MVDNDPSGGGRAKQTPEEATTTHDGGKTTGGGDVLLQDRTLIDPSFAPRASLSQIKGMQDACRDFVNQNRR